MFYQVLYTVPTVLLWPFVFFSLFEDFLRERETERERPQAKLEFEILPQVLGLQVYTIMPSKCWFFEEVNEIFS
jgi:hypothetical protein